MSDIEVWSGEHGEGVGVWQNGKLTGKYTAAEIFNAMEFWEHLKTVAAASGHASPETLRQDLEAVLSKGAALHDAVSGDYQHLRGCVELLWEGARELCESLADVVADNLHLREGLSLFANPKQWPSIAILFEDPEGRLIPGPILADRYLHGTANHETAETTKGKTDGATGGYDDARSPEPQPAR